MEGVQLQPGLVSDIDAMFEIHRAVFRGHIERLWGWDEGWQRTAFRQEWAASSTAIVLIDGAPGGYVQTVDETDTLRIWNIALRPDVQRRGIGSGIVRSLQHAAGARGVPLSLRVFATNTLALQLYLRLGFHELSRDATAVEMKWDAIRLESVR